VDTILEALAEQYHGLVFRFDRNKDWYPLPVANNRGTNFSLAKYRVPCGPRAQNIAGISGQKLRQNGQITGSNISGRNCQIRDARKGALFRR
jgi:hypothetical protein